MAKSVIWTQTALQDLERAVEYIYEDSPGYAFSFLYDVRDKAQTLDILSHRGRVVPEMNDQDVREIFIHRYRLIYKIEEERIIILTLVHGARDWNSL